MRIINQDKDLILNLSTKDIFYKKHYAFHNFKFTFMGWNLYAKTNTGRVLLGTFDSPESCKATIEEMKQHEKAGFPQYTIPEECDEIIHITSDLEVSGGVEYEQ
jgi:hypothetical protein